MVMLFACPVPKTPPLDNVLYKLPFSFENKNIEETL